MSTSTGDRWGKPATARETTENEQRARAREKVAAAARQGEDPHSVFSAEDLTWAFDGHRDELAQLVDVAEQARRLEADNRHRVHGSRALARETQRVLDEWDQKAQAERRAAAMAEARRRLGLDTDQRDAA